MSRLRALLLTLIILIPHWGDTADWISIKLNPNGGFVSAGTTVTALIRIEANKDNLSILTGVECEAYSTHSVISLDEKSPTSFRREWPLQYEGTCRAFAVLMRKEKTKLVEYLVLAPPIQVIGLGTPIF